MLILYRFYWDLFMLILLLANVIVLPVAISFFNDDLSAHWIIFNCVSDTCFLFDVVVNFRTGELIFIMFTTMLSARGVCFISS
jgi:hypothetical protein